MMQDITEHQKTFMEGFKDGIARYDKNLPCRWVNHRDINDGFHHPNPVYSLAYEMGYEFGNLEKEIPEGKIDDLFIKLIKMLYTEHHNENNK